MLRSGSVKLVLQEIWAYLTVNHCLSRLAGMIADKRGGDPDGVSFTKVMKQARRTVIRQAADTIAEAVEFARAMAEDLRRYRHRVVPGRSAARTLKRTLRRYPERGGGGRGQPVTTRVPPKTITLRPILS